MRPLVPVALSFLCGIIACEALLWPPLPLLAGLAVSLAVIIAAYLAGSRRPALVAAPAFFFTGALFITPYSLPELSPSHILNLVRQESGQEAFVGHILEGRVLSAEATGGRTRALLDVKRRMAPGGWEQAEGRALLTISGGFGLMPGDRIRAMAMLDEPRGFGNPGEFDYGKWLSRRGVLVTGYVKSDRLVERVEPASGAAATVHSLRGKIGSFIDSSGVNNAEALKALIISARAGMDKGLKDAFASTGTAHILSISGLHVGIVAAFSYAGILLLLKRSERLLLALSARKAALALSTIPVLAYAMLAGFPVPTQRATLMVVVFTAAFVIGRGRDYLNTLALAAIVILAAAPYSAWDVSFHLTFAAMASIIIIVPRARARLCGPDGPEPSGLGKRALRLLRRGLLPMLLITVAAGIGTAPVLAYHFHRVSLVGMAANLVVVPLASLVVPALLVAAALLPISEALATIPLYAADLAFGALAASVRLFSRVPFASAWVEPPGVASVALFYGLALSLAWGWQRRWLRAALLAAALALTLASAAKGLARRSGDGLLRVTFLSVGQGDSSVVELPDGKVMLIDGGGGTNPDFDIGERVVAPFLRSKGVRSVDYMLLSHPQSDHMGGLRFIVENFRVGEFWWSGSGSLGALGEALEQRKVVIREVGGSTKSLEAGGAVVEFLHPDGAAALDTNEMSVVARLSYGSRSFLFTGDIGHESEALIRASGRPLASTVLKSAHHGSRRSSGPDFLKGAKASFVVVSAGRRNSFGMPNAETLDRYAASGMEVLRTDLGGAAVFETDGHYIKGSSHLTDR